MWRCAIKYGLHGAEHFSQQNCLCSTYDKAIESSKRGAQWVQRGVEVGVCQHKVTGLFFMDAGSTPRRISVHLHAV
jgi:hypothetical protein